jgi:N-acetylneuraminic acid mutarotase
MVYRFVVLLIAAAAIVMPSSPTLADESAPRELSFDDRVNAQMAIERVYLEHRMDSTRTLQTAAMREAISAKVRSYLVRSLALEFYWNRPVTAEMLEAEVERMVLQSRMPERLVELFEALDNDPILIQECLARQTLVSRLVSGYLSSDERIHDEASVDRYGDEPAVATVASSDLVSIQSRLTNATIGDPSGCSTGEWRQLLPTAPTPRTEAATVWTGSEMIVWGGWLDHGPTGERYDPATDVWTSTSTRLAPPGRGGATAVWTGTEMMIWGGYSTTSGDLVYPAEGGRYDPLTDTWLPMSTTGVPELRYEHTAIWAGDEMIVWGGKKFEWTAGGAATSYFMTGGRYSPATDSWAPLSTADAPVARFRHTAVWTGELMIVWGGRDGTGSDDQLASGGRYDPATNSWAPTATASAPDRRSGHTAVWTGNEMIVWGGWHTFNVLRSGGRYDPVADSWTPTMQFTSPVGREDHTAVWTGTEMVVWGGWHYDSNSYVFYRQDGGRYNPATGQWQSISLTNAPDSRREHSAVWTGTEMIVWGGYGDHPWSSGGRYDPSSDSWVPTAVTLGGGPFSDVQNYDGEQESVWTGSELIVWEGSGGRGRFDPATSAWTSMSTVNEPSSRRGQNAVWTGNEMIVWGAYDFESTGGRYDPLTDSWAVMSTVNAPASFETGTAIWAGSEMIAWGGDKWERAGGRYDPATDSWAGMSMAGAPFSAVNHSAVWTGSEMIVWGGYAGSLGDFSPGGRYNSLTDTWLPLATTGTPAGRMRHQAVWTGDEMIVWGGMRQFDPATDPEHKASGGRYDPVSDSWTMTSTVDVPTARMRFTAVWTGEEMIVWGGESWKWQPPVGPGWITRLRSGGHYDPQSDTWWPTSMVSAPCARWIQSAFWTGDEMLVWGGGEYSDGGFYSASLDLDEDGYCSPADCDESNASVHNDAPEINDGIDNQCPGDIGFGAVDEISGGFNFAGDGWISWPAQEGATQYQLARSAAADFSVDCVIEATANTGYDISSIPDPGTCRHYLVRAQAPNQGSWGLRSDGTERSLDCE